MNPANGKTLSIGCGAGFSGDRVDAAPPVVRTLIERGGPSVMMFEMLAERTLALAQLAKKANSDVGEADRRPLVATVSYGKRVRIPDDILQALELNEGDLVMFNISGNNRVEMVAAMVTERS